MDDRQSRNGYGAPHDGLMPMNEQSYAQERGVYTSPGRSAYYNRQSGSRGSFSFMTLIRLAMPYWVTVVSFTILAGVAGIFYIQNTTPVYKAKAELEMSVRRAKVINSDAVFEDPNSVRDADVIYNTRFAKFRSPTMEGLAAEEYAKRFPDHKRTKSGLTINRITLAMCLRDVKWKKNPNANIVSVSYEATDPEFAARLVNVLSHCAGLLMMQENQAISDEAVKWLVIQEQEQRELLEEVEKELIALRQELQLDANEQRKAALVQALVTVSREREDLISQLSSRKTVYEFVSELKNSDPNLEMLPSGLPKEAELNELIRDWRAANNDLLQAADRYTELHPEYKKAAELEARSKGRLKQFIEISAKAVEKEIELFEKQLDHLNTRISEMKDEALELEQSLAVGLRQLQRLERRRDAADNSYQAMLVRKEEARLSADENMAFAKVIREALVPRVPISPRKGRVMMVSMILGVAGGLLLALGTSLWIDRISSIADLKAMGVDILATIPTQKRIGARADLATIGLRDKFSPIVEIFAGINGLISSGSFSAKNKVIVTASVGPGEGKTISACNLAISSAFNGQRTLLIDGDLRKPQLSTIFNIEEEQPSLLEWLANRGAMKHTALVSEQVIENLDVITSRPHREINPAELLGRESLVDLINWARKGYDRIIIDSPPLGPVGDVNMLANLADAVIIVTRIGKTKKRGLRFGLTRFSTIDVPVLGCIANDVPKTLVGMFRGAEGYGAGYSSTYGMN
jgi:capsular exopolysaccharide synthesis family protein